jgi:phospholipid/cholesterol/gamma-HCH transport system substrate-binding protein
LEIQVGVTVLAALGVLLWGVSWLKDYQSGSNVRVWHVRFPQTGGLGKSDEVQVNGIRKGSVLDMKLVRDYVIVDLGLGKDVTLTHASQVAIRNVGLMGEKVIAVDLKAEGPAYTENDTIQGVYELGMGEVLASMGGTITSVSELAAELRSLTLVLNKDDNLAETLGNFRKTSEDLRKVVAENRSALKSTLTDFSAAAKTAKGLTTDREAELRRALDQFSQAAENMSVLSGRLDSLRATIQTVTGKVERGEGTLGKLVNDDKLYNDVNSSVQSLKALIEDVKKNPKKYLKLEIF